jgi:dolichyl-phosphate beta-glucosyltransferase
MPEALAMIIPCYNESARLQVPIFLEFAGRHPHIHLWLVNDGSTDQTWDLLQSMANQMPATIRALNIMPNGGKAEAVRKGIMHVLDLQQYTYVGFIDADLSAPLSEILPLWERIQNSRLKIIAGARVKLVGRTIVRSPVRHYLGRVFATYQDTLLQLGNYDTQCGLKIFQAHFASQIFRETFCSNWFFDIELFVRARKILGNEGYNKEVEEVPMQEWKEVKGSKLKLADFMKAPFQVYKIYKQYK